MAQQNADTLNQMVAQIRQEFEALHNLIDITQTKVEERREIMSEPTSSQQQRLRVQVDEARYVAMSTNSLGRTRSLISDANGLDYTNNLGATRTIQELRQQFAALDERFRAIINNS